MLAAVIIGEVCITATGMFYIHTNYKIVKNANEEARVLMNSCAKLVDAMADGLTTILKKELEE